MPEQDVAELYQLLLLKEKLRLRNEISERAEAENKSEVWSGLPDFIRAYRLSRKA